MIRTTLALAAALLSTAAVSAADLIIPVTPEPIYKAGGFDWDGMYVGARAGGEVFTLATFGVVGAVAGVNFVASDSLLFGVEVSADYTWNNFARGVELYANARAGWLVTDSALVYALAGAGVYTSGGNSIGFYQAGGGVEFAVTDAVTLRGELTGFRSFTSNSGRLFDAAKATAGVFDHF
jgi:outer membrane immunogenic protein